MMRKILIPILVLLILPIGACSVYRPTIQQGNILDIEQVDKLKLGMSKRQVTYVLGTPLLEDPFHTDRWDYLHTIKDGNNQKMSIQRLTLYFENGSLARIDKSNLAKKFLN
jgi:outer membrane protein assembly factor BamE